VRVYVSVCKVVGEGAYGRVMLARDTETAEGRPVAIKEFKVSDDDPDAEEVRRTSRREVALLKMLNHPHIVKYLNEFYDQENKLFVVMEFVPRNLLEVKPEPPSLGPWRLAWQSAKCPTL